MEKETKVAANMEKIDGLKTNSGRWSMARRVIFLVLVLVLSMPVKVLAVDPIFINKPADDLAIRPLPVNADTLDYLDSTDFASSTDVKDLHSQLDNEASERAAADNDLQSQIDNEASERAATDAGLDRRLTSVESYESRIAALESQLTAALDLIADLESSVLALDPDGVLAKLANHVMVADSTINGLAGPHVIFRGANIHVQNGLHQTMENGLGNLIVGYNELSTRTDPKNRTGSHNLIVGYGHEYTDSGGFVAGMENKIFGWGASVSGGVLNTAIGQTASISGGERNVAREYSSSVSGGFGNEAGGWHSSVSGGSENVARGSSSSVSGGRENVAANQEASVGGGYANTAEGNWSSVCGGWKNTAQGQMASVSGGSFNLAYHRESTVSGGRGLATTNMYEHLP